MKKLIVEAKFENPPSDIWLNLNLRRINLIKKYFANHPFNDGALATADMKLKINNHNPNIDYELGRSKDRITIRLSELDYLGVSPHCLTNKNYNSIFIPENFSLGGFRFLITHELAHYFDAKNKKFTKNRSIRDFQKGLDSKIRQIFRMLWNFYIDYRIWPKSRTKMAARKKEFFEIYGIKLDKKLSDLLISIFHKEPTMLRLADLAIKLSKIKK